MFSSQRLVFSFLEFLGSECESRSEDEKESLEVVIECLERVYNVSLSNSSDVSKFHVAKSLTEIFEEATQQTTARNFPTAEDKKKSEELKTQGNNLMKEGRYEDAINWYNKAVDLDWTNAVYLCNRAAAFSKLEQHEVAVKDCKAALELDPKYSKAYGRMGTAYMALEKYQEARDSFAKAKELDPDNELYTSNLHTAEEKLKEAKEKTSSGNPGNLMNSLFSNPGIMNMASQFMSNPQAVQMMTNMMSGFAGVSGGQPAAAPPNPSEPAGAPPDPAGRNSTENSSEEANPAGAGGYSNIFQFATQMAQQLEQSNPELINSLRQTMQNVRGETTDENKQDPKQNEEQ